MKFQILLFAALVALALGNSPIGVDPGGSSGSNPDLSNTDLTNNFCETKGKRCPGKALGSASRASTSRQCVTRCIKNIECVSAFYGTDKNCQLLSSRCASKDLKKGSGSDLYRLNKGEECPAGRPAYVASKIKYTNNFCMAWGKKCPGRDLYKKPQNIKPMMECLKKCAKIASCGMVDFDGKCSPKEQACSDDELVDDPNTQNFVRLVEGVTTCAGGRTEPSETKPVKPTKPVSPPAVVVPPEPKYCDRQFLDCTWNDIQHIPWTFDLSQCKEYCNANDACKSIHFGIHGGCWLKNKVCRNDELNASAGTDSVRVAPGTDCSPYSPHTNKKYCRKHGQNCLFHDIRTWLFTPSLARCEYYCSHVPKCKAVYRTHIGGTCFLKDFVCGRHWLSPFLPGIGDSSLKC